MSQLIQQAITITLSMVIALLCLFLIVKPLLQKLVDYLDARINRGDEIALVKEHIKNFKDLNWEGRIFFFVNFLACREQSWATARDFLKQAVTIDPRMMGLLRFLCADYLEHREEEKKAKKKQQESGTKTGV